MAGVKGRSGGSRLGAGRPRFEATSEQRALVAQLAACGLEAEDMLPLILNARGKPITLATLLRHFAQELSQGRLQATIAVAQALLNKAKNGDNTCMVFWLRTRAGWGAARLHAALREGVDRAVQGGVDSAADRSGDGAGDGTGDGAQDGAQDGARYAASDTAFDGLAHFAGEGAPHAAALAPQLAQALREVLDAY